MLEIKSKKLIGTFDTNENSIEDEAACVALDTQNSLRCVKGYERM
jgi:hypothetical protein